MKNGVAIWYWSGHEAWKGGQENISELLIDSKYKTSSSKLELFASVFGAAFPLAYFLLESWF